MSSLVGDAHFRFDDISEKSTPQLTTRPMTEVIRVASIDDVPPGSAKELTAAGRIVALYNVDGKFHALDGVCPHAGGPLGQGDLQGCVVTCPWHGWQFDVTNGENCLNSNIRHPGFVVKVENRDVFVEIP